MKFQKLVCDPGGCSNKNPLLQEYRDIAVRVIEQYGAEAAMQYLYYIADNVEELEMEHFNSEQ